MGYSPDSNNVSREAEESPLLRAVTKQRLVKTYSVVIFSVEIRDTLIGICSYEM
jgi:hypothetical protein